MADAAPQRGNTATWPAAGGAPKVQAAQACFGTPDWPVKRPVPQASVEFEVADADAETVQATHAATESGELACGTWTRHRTPVADVDTDLEATTCHFCCAELGLDDETSVSGRLEALFVLSLTLGLRPRELRKLSWEHVDLGKGSSTCGGQPAGPVTSRRRSRSAPSSCPGAP
jgi:hypothetical protein